MAVIDTNTFSENPIYKQSFIVLLIIVFGLSYLFRDNKPKEEEDSEPTPKTALESSIIDLEGVLFYNFKRNYLLVYTLVNMADWLQGPYVYALYFSYGYEVNEIAILFVAGFLSSAIFGTLIGGRKLTCLAFCIIYAISCLTKLSSSFNVLMVGRITGGIATSLLFSVFEAWMVSEFYSRGFKEELLSDIFSWSTFLNGLAAIFSGVVANSLVDYFGRTSDGYVAPFMGAIFVLVVSFGVIWVTWKENYGENSSNAGQSALESIKEAVGEISKDFPVFAAGSMQCFFESAMYTFVFMWSPALEKLKDESESLPFGIIFASFMVSIMIGSIIFKVLVQKGVSHEVIARGTFLTAALTFFFCIISINLESEGLLFFFFNIFEGCCGIYFPSVGTIRSKFIPEHTRATVMNIFRVPLNLIVVVSLLKVSSMEHTTLFMICLVSNLVSFIYAHRLVLMSDRGELVSQHKAVKIPH